MCDGEVIYGDGGFAGVNRDLVLRALHEALQKALADNAARRRLSMALLPHLKAPLHRLFRPERYRVFYRPSARM